MAPHSTTCKKLPASSTTRPTAESTNAKVQAWWAHKVSYPWLLVSLNRFLSHMDKRHWDLTPNDTNPIEGSHAQDNQIKPTSRPLLEAILLAKDLDAQTARTIKLKAQRQARAQEKRRTSEAELITRKESRNLQNKIKATQQENEDLRKQIALLTQVSGSIPPSTPQRPLPVASSSRLSPSPSNSIIDVDALSDSDDDFDYAAALKSDVMSPIFKKMARDYAMPGVDDESN
ncbi:hypothetical protein R3P38DRAFT_3624547 [Favolaschia claudopus]|uniref:BZIP domain-containing protein n=1 Tax=Favolaschia claudopus TaxID=2862362 RepID=A0AAW0A1V7_9AGAR